MNFTNLLIWWKIRYHLLCNTQCLSSNCIVPNGSRKLVYSMGTKQVYSIKKKWIRFTWFTCKQPNSIFFSKVLYYMNQRNHSSKVMYQRFLFIFWFELNNSSIASHKVQFRNNKSRSLVNNLVFTRTIELKTE